MGGRKRHPVVDTLGLLPAVAVHAAADVQDRDGGGLALTKLAGRFPRPWVTRADGGSAGKRLVWASVAGGRAVEPAETPAGATPLAVLPERRSAERTFAWLGRSRRPSQDGEAPPEAGEARIRVARLHLMPKRLAPP